MSASFSSDQPISSKSEDSLGRASFALRIAETIANRKDESSVAIGLYGVWGDGKTSVLKMMQEYLDEIDDVIVVNFNPWRFESEENFLRNFFSNFVKVLGTSLPTLKENIGEFFERYGGAIPLYGDNAEKLGKALSVAELEDLKKRVEKILKDNQKKVVIFIDDIDRLDRDEIYAIFKLVRLTASFNHTTYILAFDHDIVSSALGERYAQGGKAAGEAFLEKIIQVPLHLPHADANNLRTMTLEGVNIALNQSNISLTSGQKNLFLHCFDSGIIQKITTPRLSRLYYNALLFSLPLLKGEVNPVDQILLEGIRISLPGLYRQIRKTPQIFLTGMPQRGLLEKKSSEDYRKFAEDLLAECLPELISFERQEILNNLLPSLFPGLLGYGPPRDADKDKRISSGNYFWKYFMYAVPSDDFSDIQLDYFLETVTNTKVDVVKLFDGAGGEGYSSSFIRKLLNRIQSMDEHTSHNLFKFFIDNINMIHIGYKQFSLGDDARSMAKKLLAELLRKITNRENQKNLIVEFVAVAIPLDFVVATFLQEIRFVNSRFEESRIISAEDEALAFSALANRILNIDRDTPLYAFISGSARQCYYVVGTTVGYDALADRLKSRFDSSPEDVDLFLVSLAGQRWVSGSYEPECGDLDNDNYVQISQMIDPQYIMNNLTSRFGDALDVQANRHEEISPNLKVAREFVWLHRALLRKNEDQSLAE